MKFKFRSIAFAAIAFVFMASMMPSKAVPGDADDHHFNLSYWEWRMSTSASL
ncbi:MAG: hypothetical protein LBP36_02485 [Oscillospiraceae bacterium]|nr:hypothetical protein [Oscillospiraceae bacterium]